MAANTSPLFPLTPNVGQGKITGANTARDGTGSNLVTVYTAGANGGRLGKIQWAATGQTAAAQLTFFYVSPSATYTFIGEQTVPAVTPSTTLAAAAGLWTPPVGYDVLPAGASIVCGLTVVPVSGALHVTSWAGDF